MVAVGIFLWKWGSRRGGGGSGICTHLRWWISTWFCFYTFYHISPFINMLYVFWLCDVIGSMVLIRWSTCLCYQQSIQQLIFSLCLTHHLPCTLSQPAVQRSSKGMIWHFSWPLVLFSHIGYSYSTVGLPNLSFIPIALNWWWPCQGRCGARKPSW